MRGASAVEKILQRQNDPTLRVLVVWEPMLPSDWGLPKRWTLTRIPDTRARQFWDPQRLIAQRLKEFATENPAQPHPDCCVDKGFFWDEAIVFRAGSRWREAPVAAFWNGTVLRTAGSLEQALQPQS